ncbi:MAG TPA: biotin--[acetyl-CoA-carboxylase] ligase [Allosphingosinicella sp.]|jgi:BirA family biotin operon repressor/biotin-[acetyl-CoA-carboxylase] ligase
MLRFVAETGSTNDDLLALARDGAPEGLWLRAGRQTGGKGRQGRAWQSPPGNLYGSTLVRLRQGDPPAPTLALVAAVALHEVAAIHSEGRDLRIKWPNDILLDGAKLAGILLERSGDAVVIGFGVNLARPPEGLGGAAAAVGQGVEPEAMLETLAEAFARWLGRWRGEGLAPVRAGWLAAAHPIGTALSTPDGKGLFDGLDESGALRLRRADGSIHIVHAGDVFLI